MNPEPDTNPENNMIGSIQMVDIDEQMRTAYIEYAMSVIVARALPDARDGLKPVHRRILFAMKELGIHANSSYKKSARIVGEVLGKYHPHGDAAVYESMARMAQDFSMRYLMVDGQGNFGSVDGDSPAAMRYTEARLAKMAEEMLTDIEKDTVNFADNFDGSLQEPVVLPSRLPNMLLNGASGIAVGMATNIPPHNLRELTSAINYLIDHYDGLEDVPAEELMKFVKGPDFPTGGIIVGKEGIEQAYGTGRGRVVIRGVAHIEEMKGGRYRIIITEIPYQVNKTTLIERIADLARSGKIGAISDLRDESDRRGMNIVVELKRNSQPKKVLNQLYKFTALQSTFGVSMLALVDNEPRTLPLKKSLTLFIQHRQEVITRRIQFDLNKAKHRAHILEGLKIALDNLDAVIETIRNSPDVDAARERLIDRFNLSEIQAQAILDMQLRRLAALERQKIDDEYKQVMVQIANFEDLLSHPKKILAIIQEDMNELNQKYGDERRTRIALEAREDINEEDLVADESVLVSITERGYVKRVAATSYRSQHVGGRGVTGHSTREKDEVMSLIPAHTLDTMLFFSDRGKVYAEKVYQIPGADRTNKGIPMVNIISLDPGEIITAAVAVTKFVDEGFIALCTVHGKVKRMDLSKLSSVRPSGIIAIKLATNDKLGWVRLTTGNDDIILVTEQGQALRFNETQLRSMGRTGAGVRGIKLGISDSLTSMEVVEPEGSLLVVTANGFGKRSKLDLYPTRRRSTKGIATTSKKALGSIGLIASARVVQDPDDITIMSANGHVLRAKVKNLRLAGRATKGVKLMNMKDGDRVVSIARISSAELKKYGAIKDDDNPPNDKS